MRGSLPALTRFQNDHQDIADQFQILAFHDDSVVDFEELDEQLESIQKKHWGGKPLPFPILLDESGETVEAFGIEAFPTMVLIDPDGNVVGESSEKELAEKLGLKDEK